MKFAVKTIFLFIVLCSGSFSMSAQDFLPELVKRIKPSAVAIETFDAKGNTLSRGSGFFVASDKVITNRHVIEKSSRAEIHLFNGKKFPVKGVLAIDGEGDLALLQVDVPAGTAVPLQIMQRVPLEGESIVVIGNPYGLEGSVSNVYPTVPGLTCQPVAGPARACLQGITKTFYATPPRTYGIELRYKFF